MKKIVMLFLLAATTAWGVTAPAKVAYFEGKVMVLRKGEKTPVPAELGMSLFYGDQVKTITGKCQVNMTASGILRLSPNTTVLFPEAGNASDEISVKKMLIGKTVTNIRQLMMDEVFEVRSPSLVAGVDDGHASETLQRYGAALEQMHERVRKEIERVRAEGNAKLDAIRAELKRVEGKPISRACSSCGKGGPHRGTDVGWECNCGSTVTTFGNYPTSHGSYNQVKETYQQRIAALEQQMR